MCSQVSLSDSSEGDKWRETGQTEILCLSRIEVFHRHFPISFPSTVDPDCWPI